MYFCSIRTLSLCPPRPCRENLRGTGPPPQCMNQPNNHRLVRLLREHIPEAPRPPGRKLGIDGGLPYEEQERPGPNPAVNASDPSSSNVPELALGEAGEPVREVEEQVRVRDDDVFASVIDDDVV